MAVYKTSNSGLLTRREYTSFLAGNTMFDPWQSPGAYDSIATYAITSNTASVTFSSIPQTYTHLQVRFLGRDTRTGATQQSTFIRMNGDTGNNYVQHGLLGDGSAATAFAQTGRSNLNLCVIPTSSSPASMFGTSICDILDYTNTNKYKTTRTLSGEDQNNADGTIYLFSGLWMSTSAISSLTVYPNNGESFVQYSSIALYGIKGN